MELDKAKKLLEALGKMQAEGRGEGLPCPRCGRDYMAANPVRNALSRRVKVYICDACGMDEAIRDMAGFGASASKPMGNAFEFYRRGNRHDFKSLYRSVRHKRLIL